jgi:hypothetical protein
MSKPNINIPAEFAVNGIKTDFDNSKLLNGFYRLNPDVLAGDNLNKFIDDTYKGLNGVLDLYEGCVLYDSTVTYTNKSLIFDITNNGIKFYHSLQNGNINHSLTDTDYWEEIDISGANKVNKSGDTMTGALRVQTDYNIQINICNTQIEQGVLPTDGTKYEYYSYKDVNNATLGALYYRFGTDGDVSVRMSSSNLTGSSSAYIAVGFDTNGNKYFTFPKCTTVPTTTSSANNNLVAVVVENYKSGNSWYRVYSDGFCEQGGLTASYDTNPATITLLKNYSSTNYSVQCTQVGSNARGYAMGVTDKTTSGFKVYSGYGTNAGVSANAGNSKTCWYAYGY